MSENPLVLDRFIDYINVNCSNAIRVQKHNKAEEVDIGIQQSITKIVDSMKLELLVEPYLRLAHFQSTIFAPYLDRSYYSLHFGTDKVKCLALWGDITKEWKHSTWGQLKNKLLTEYKGIIDKVEFEQGFANKFENTNRGYVHVSFGYEVTAYIPENIFKQLERKGGDDKQDDRLAQFINRVIKTLIDKIV